MDDDKNKQRLELQKYAFYFERYANNHSAIQSINKIFKQYKAGGEEYCY